MPRLLSPTALDKRGKYILGELVGWTLEQQIEFIAYLLELLIAKKEKEPK